MRRRAARSLLASPLILRARAVNPVRVPLRLYPPIAERQPAFSFGSGFARLRAADVGRNLLVINEYRC